MESEIKCFTSDHVSTEEQSICDKPQDEINSNLDMSLSQAESHKLPIDKILVSEFKQMKLEKEAQKNWDLFCKRNTTHFFKDRHWTTQEFEELKLCREVLMDEVAFIDLVIHKQVQASFICRFILSIFSRFKIQDFIKCPTRANLFAARRSGLTHKTRQNNNEHKTLWRQSARKIKCQDIKNVKYKLKH